MGWADNCRDGGTYIGKDGKRHSYDRLIVAAPTGGCLMMTSLMLAAPTALVALVVKGARR